MNEDFRTAIDEKEGRMESITRRRRPGRQGLEKMLSSLLTLIIINVIVTVHLQWNGTI